MRKSLVIALAAASLCVASACQGLDDDRIPPLAVSINLGNQGLWNTYGVAGFGLSRRFIRELGEPSGYSYTDRTYTGFGGVLLIGGMDPFTNDTNQPQAYDLACPVECKADVRVYVDPDNFEAVCPVCHSRYDVTMAGGTPLSGPAKEYRYALRRYQCLAAQAGGYIITR